MQNRSMLFITVFKFTLGPFKCYVTQWGVGGCQLSRTKTFTKVYGSTFLALLGWVGVKFPGKKSYVTLERSLLRSDRFKAISSTKRIVGSFEHK